MRIRKSKNNILLTGLLGGLGESFQMDPTIIRIIFAVLAMVSPYPMIPLYILLSLIVPKGISDQEKTTKKKGSDQIIDKNSIHPHNINSLSERNEIEEEDWSDF